MGSPELGATIRKIMKACGGVLDAVHRPKRGGPVLLFEKGGQTIDAPARGAGEDDL